MFSPAWVLAAPRALKEVAETWGQGGGEQGGVLFLAYCLSHDQRWLLAAATDARGELLDTAAINIHVPHRYDTYRLANTMHNGHNQSISGVNGEYIIRVVVADETKVDIAYIYLFNLEYTIQ